jgi:hypothetical protein
MAKVQEWSWVKVTKTFRGGSTSWQIRLPKGVKLSKREWDTILEWIGEHTHGGHNYGYELRTRRLKAKSTKLLQLRYPSGLNEKLEDFGDEVVTTRRMI